MNITDFKQALPYLFEAQLTAFVWGNSGIGKTTVVRDFAKSKGWHFFPLYLGTQSDSGDILGLADFTVRPDGTKSTDFAAPGWIKDAVDYCNNNPDSGAIIFLDEFNRGRRDILQGMFSLALDKTFHTMKLPKNCHVIAAGNPPTDEYSVTDVNDTALMARFVHIKLEPSFNEFLDFGKAHDFEPTILTFLREQPELLEDHKSNFSLPIKVDRRSYERLNRLFDLETPEQILTQLMYGILGVERTVAYQQHLKNADRPLTGEQVLTGASMDKVDIWSTPGNIVASLLSNTCDNLQETIKQLDEKDTLLTEDQKVCFMNFLLKIPKETAVTFLKKLSVDNRSKILKDLTLDKDRNDTLTRLVLVAKGIDPETVLRKAKK